MADSKTVLLPDTNHHGEKATEAAETGEDDVGHAGVVTS